GTTRDGQCLGRESADPENLPAGTLCEVIESAVRSDVEIDGIGNAGRETVRSAGRGIEDTDPAAAEIGKKILAGIGGRELRHWRVIESGTDNGAAGGIG